MYASKFLVSLALLVLPAQVVAQCQNDEAFRFYDISPPKAKERSCRNIRLQEARRLLLCKDASVNAACPQTCGTCCSDSTTYIFKTNDGENKTCVWLAAQDESTRGEYCITQAMTANQGRTVRDGCPVACGVCQTEVSSVTGSPTISAAPSKAKSAAPSGNPTSAPSGKPSVAPTGKPSISPTDAPSRPPSPQPSPFPTSKPTFAPIVPQPSPFPTSKPTFAPIVEPSFAPSSSPTSNPTQSCRDDPTFRRNNVEMKSCDWIGATEKKRSKNCSIQNVIDNCPQACRLCCDDDEDFRLEIEGGDFIQCEWISQKEARQKKYCGKKVNKKAAENAGALITNKCGESCGRCAAPSSMPTIVV